MINVASFILLDMRIVNIWIAPLCPDWCYQKVNKSKYIQEWECAVSGNSKPVLYRNSSQHVSCAANFEQKVNIHIIFLCLHNHLIMEITDGNV